MLKIKSSLRVKKMYILAKAKKEDLEKAILDYIGILGWARAAPVFLVSGNNCIVAVNRSELVNVRAAFAFYKEKIDVLKVSGTLKGLKK